MDVFYSDEDRAEHLRLLSEQGERFRGRFVSCSLMTNHVHLIAIPNKEDSLARGIGEAHRLYTRRVHFREGVRGCLFQGRLHSADPDEAHLYAAVGYVERNPVRAGLVEEAWEYEWSSARRRVGLRGRDRLVEEAEKFPDVADWREFLRSHPPELERLRERSRTGHPCGSDDFVRRVERVTGRRLQPLPRCRPGKARE